MRVWIDLANAPHVRFFEPVYDELRRRGHVVLLTVRDHRETATLARRVWPWIEPDSGSSPNGPLRKGVAFASRAAALRGRAKPFRADVAVSHNSYAQLLAARLLGIPSVTAMDYEHQPANHVAFRLATRIVVPDVFPRSALHRYGARPEKVRRYRGFKEELYLRKTAPRGERGRLGVPEDAPLAVVRLPPDGALYHQHRNDFVDEIVASLVAQGASVVVLARSNEQRSAWRGRAEDGLLVPEPPVDTESLLVEADAFVGAGGTMTREAALLGTRSYSIFRGRTAAVDEMLERQGLLTIMRSPADLRRIQLVPETPADQVERSPGGRVLDVLLAAIAEVGERAQPLAVD